MSGGLQGLSLGNVPLYEKGPVLIDYDRNAIITSAYKRNSISTGVISLEGNRPVYPRDSLKH